MLGWFGGSFNDKRQGCCIDPFEAATGAKVLVKLGNSAQHAAAVRATAGQSDMDVVFADDAFAAADGERGQSCHPRPRQAQQRSRYHRRRYLGGRHFLRCGHVERDDDHLQFRDGEDAADVLGGLFDEKYANRIAIGDITGTSGWQFLAAVNKLAEAAASTNTPGIEKIKPLAKSSVLLYTQADQVVSLFERGEIDIAVWYPDRAALRATGRPAACRLLPFGGRCRHPPDHIDPQGHQTGGSRAQVHRHRSGGRGPEVLLGAQFHWFREQEGCAVRRSEQDRSDR